MSSSGILSPYPNPKIFDELVPNPYPYPAQPPSLAQVLTAGDDAGNGNIENLDILQTTNVVQQDTSGQQFLIIGGTILTPGSGGDLRIQGATLKGSILAGDGTSTVGLPVGANGLVLKANSATATGLEWGTDASGGTVMAVNAGVNIDVSGTIAQPIVNLQNPLTAQLNIGSQTIVGATTALTETTTLDINANSAVAGLVELDFNDVAVPKSISAFNNIRISNIEAGAVMKFDTNDTGTGEIKTALKEETIKENEHQISITIVDTGGITNGEITRTIITSGDDTGCEDTITSTDNTNIRVALRKEETDWAFGVVDTTTYTSQFLGNTVASRTSTANGQTVSEACSYSDGLAQAGYSFGLTATGGGVGGSTLNQSLTSGGAVCASQILATNTLAQHQLRRTAGTQNAYIQNNAQANLSRLQGQLIDTGIGNYTTLDTTNSNCEIRQQVLVGGITKNASLITTNALTTLSSDAPLTISTSGGDMTLNASAGNVLVEGFTIAGNTLSTTTNNLDITTASSSGTGNINITAKPLSGNITLTCGGAGGAGVITASTVNGNIALNTSGTGDIQIDAEDTARLRGKQGLTLETTAVGGFDIAVNSTRSVNISTAGASSIASNPSLLLQATSALTTSYPVIKMDRPTPASLVGDVVGAISTWADDASGVSREWSRIQTQSENVSAGNQDATLSIWNSVNGTISQTFNFNGGQNENNSFRPLDMNGNDIRSNTGSMIISTLPSTGTGNLDVKAKASAQFGGETGFTNVYNTNGEIQFNCGGGDWVMTCPAWESPTAGGNSGQHLRIKLNGVYYKIQLLND
jgi:hypothetical protein